MARRDVNAEHMTVWWIMTVSIPLTQYLFCLCVWLWCGASRWQRATASSQAPPVATHRKGGTPGASSVVLDLEDHLQQQTLQPLLPRPKSKSHLPTENTYPDDEGTDCTPQPEAFYASAL